MKRFIMSLALIASLFSGVYAVNGDIATFTTGSDVEKISIDVDGNLISRDSGVKIGSSAHPFASIYVSSYSVPLVAFDYFSDVPTASSCAAYTVLTATKSATAKVYGTSLLTQNSYGRTISISIGNDDDDTKTATGSAIVSGTNSKGEVVNETVALTAAITQCYTSNAFVYVGSVTITVSTWETQGVQSNLRVNIGMGAKIGLSNDIFTAADVISVREGTAIVNPGTSWAGIDTTYDTVDFATDPNGTNDYQVFYKIRKAP